jgi:hypothetical protein
MPSDNTAILNLVSKYVGVDISTILYMSQRAPKSYKRYEIDKHNGQKRVIYHPAKPTKLLQYAIIELFLSKMLVHESAVAYIKGLKSPLKHTAMLHSNYPYSIRIDMKDFFPSIRPNDIIKRINNNIHRLELPNSASGLEDIDKQFLKNSLFAQKKSSKSFFLAIGAPSSPIISNIVMYELDRTLFKYAQKFKCQYTRYSDDIVFSAHRKKDCIRFLNYVKTNTNKITSPKLILNEHKTIFMSRGGKRIITGLYITPEGEISIGRNRKRYIRKLIFDYANSNISQDDIYMLQGYLAFVNDVEPQFLRALNRKYGNDIISSIFKSIKTENGA